MAHTGYQGQEYRRQEILSASPIRLVVIAYDLAIQSCEQGDFVRATQTVSALRDALNFDYPETSIGLFRTYQWVLDSIRAGDYTSALNALAELRNAWIEAEKKLEAQSAKQPQQGDASTTIARA